MNTVKMTFIVRVFRTEPTPYAEDYLTSARSYAVAEKEAAQLCRDLGGVRFEMEWFC